MSRLPAAFLERLRQILSAASGGGPGFPIFERRPAAVRANTLRISAAALEDYLRERGWKPGPVGFCPEAFRVPAADPEVLRDDPWVVDGRAYLQSVSSLVPVCVLDPRPGDTILDACAAPGSKTTQMAARMRNQGRIAAVEAVRGRYFRLKSQCGKSGVLNADFFCLDARRFKSDELFDKILIDAPCSSEGLFDERDSETFAYWSVRKVREMARKQRGILLAASRLLKKGGTLVYSTCTFAPEENEGCVDWFLRKAAPGFRVEPVSLAGVPALEAVTAWEKKSFDPRVRACLRVAPHGDFGAFFVAKLVLE